MTLGIYAPNQKVDYPGIRHFLRDDSISPGEQREIIQLAHEVKAHPYDKTPFAGPQGVAVLFDKFSSRTRFSFDIGIAQLGGHPMVVAAGDTQIGHSESIPDTARVLSRFAAMIIWRTYAQASLDELSQFSRVPVVNALSDSFHPCQLLSDLFTIWEKKGDLAGLTLTFVGDGQNNMAHSCILAGLLAGIDVIIGTPVELIPDKDVCARAEEIGKHTGARLRVIHDPVHAVAGADVVYTDAWISMGYSAEKARVRTSLLGAYQVNEELLAHAAHDAVVMHCLPAHRGEEITSDVMDGPRSVIFDQAENRLHAQKALMCWLMENNKG